MHDLYFFQLFLQVQLFQVRRRKLNSSDIIGHLSSSSSSSISANSFFALTIDIDYKVTILEHNLVFHS